MAVLPVQKSLADIGVVLTYQAAASGGDTFANSARERLRVHNGGGASITITIAGQKKCNQGFLHDSVTPLAAGAEILLGPFDSFRFNDPTGKVHVAYSAVTSVTVAVEG